MAVSKDLRFLHQKITGDMRKIVSANEKSGQRADWKVFDALDASASVLMTQIEEAERREAMEKPTENDLYSRAFSAYLRRGVRATPHQAGLTDEERSILYRGEPRDRRDMGVNGQAAYPGATAGFFAPMDFMGRVESAMMLVCPLLSAATVIPTPTGAPLPVPTDADVQNSVGERIVEGAQTQEQDISAVGQVVLKSYRYSSRIVKMSAELVQDTGFPLEDYLAERFGVRIAKALGPDVITGSGSPNMPMGILTAATVGLSATTSPAIVGNDNATSPDPTQQIGYGDIVNLTTSVDATYRRNGSFLLNDNTLAYIKNLRDKEGRPLHAWKPEGGPFGSVLGFPCLPSLEMPLLAAGNTTLAFGDFSKYFIRHTPATILRMEERFVDYGQVGFVMYERLDGQLIDAGSHPVKTLVQHP